MYTHARAAALTQINVAPQPQVQVRDWYTPAMTIGRNNWGT
jgi:hypothetical protein